MKKKKCDKCKGSGGVTDNLLALLTFGVSLLMNDKDKCPRCNGKGYIRGSGHDR